MLSGNVALIILLMILYRKISCSILLFAAILCVDFSHGLFAQNTPNTPNTVNYGFDKILNTYLFKFSGNYFLSTNYGAIAIQQNYQGTALTSLKDYFRDDEAFNLQYKLPIFEDFNFILASNYILNSDNKSNNNQLQRLNGIANFEWLFFDNAKIRAGYGMENHRQINRTNAAEIVQLEMNVDNFNLDGYNLNFSSSFDNLILSDDRNNLDFFVSSLFSKEYEKNNSLEFSINYKKQGRDFLVPSLAEKAELPIESRREDRLAAALSLNFSFFDDLLAKIDFTFENLVISRDFNSEILGNNYSFIQREFNENALAFTTQAIYSHDRLNQRLGLSISLRNDNNFVSNKFDLNKNEFEKLKGFEQQRDNQNTVSKIFSQTSLQISSKYSLMLSFLLSLNRYDTPSNDNNDDRDEQNYHAALGLKHSFSENLSGKTLLEYSGNHLVFIKSQRSSLNNNNRILRLAALVDYQDKVFSWKPKFEVLANYTSYDFEKSGNTTQSYSFRQISYNDSISYIFDKTNSLEYKWYSRYFERGILYWKSFSETPQSANIEIFANILYYISTKNSTRIGIGGRFYKLKQYNLPNSGLPANLNDFSQTSLGPEININFQLSFNSNVVLKGWYDFRSVNKHSPEGIGNLIILTKINL